MRILLIAGVVCALFAVSCCECMKDEAPKKETKKEVPKKEVPKVASRLAPYETAEGLLKKVSPDLEYIKLAMKPDVLESVGAKKFHAFRAKEAGEMLLLHVFEYADAEGAGTGIEKLPAMIAGEELLHHVKLVANGNLVLAAGVGSKDELGETEAAKLAEYVKAFSGR